MSKEAISEFLRALQHLMAQYQQDERVIDPGRDKSVAYGNVRYQVWEDGSHINIGIIYETPGGSTNQINIEYNPETREFSMPHATDPGDYVGTEFDEVLEMVHAHIQQIPEKRMERLQDYINAWHSDGVSRPDIFERLNQLIFQDLKGGRITHEELHEACRYAVGAESPGA
ncbi:MAG: hypothetical protein GF320_18170 [Armatimonadia bacterium]|nr:hypothetical protein [Armatimonadia bacterium]